MITKYVLNGKEVVPCSDLIEWAKWIESADREVARDDIGDVRISTVFLGLDHSFGEGPPLLFETMVFGGPQDQKMDRYSTWEEAEEGHKKMLKKQKEKTP